MDEAAKQSSAGQKQQEGAGGDVAADTVNITQGGARDVKANQVTLRQAGAQSVTADNVVIRQGGAFQVKTDQLEIHQGGLVIGQAGSANLTTTGAGALLVGGDAQMEMSGARLLLARGDVTVDQGGAVVMAAPQVRAQNCGVVVLLAGRVEGTVNAVFDLSGGGARAALVGAAVGLLAGLALRGGIRRRR